MYKRHGFHLLVWLVLAAFPASAAAQEPMTRAEFEEQLADWNFQLNRAETELVKRGPTQPLLESLRADVKKIQEQTSEVAQRSSAQAERLRALLQALGPPPGEGEPPEEASVAERRSQLRDRLAMFEGRVKQAELTAARARQLMERQTERLRRQAAEELFHRVPSPLSWSVLSSAGPHMVSAVNQLISAPLDAWVPALTGETGLKALTGLLAATALAFVLGWPLRRWLIRHYVRDRETESPTYANRVVNAVMVAVSRGVLPALLAAAPLAVLLMRGARRGIAGDMLVAGLTAVIGVVLVSGLARAALAPASPRGWRLTPLTDKSARALYRRIRQVLIIAATLFFVEFFARRQLYISEELAILYSFVGDTLLAVFIFALLPKRLWQTEEQVPAGEARQAARTAFKIRLLRGAVALAAIAIPISSLLGFISFADYLVDNLLITGLVLGAWIVFHGLAREILAIVFKRGEPPDDERGEEQTVRDSTAPMLRFWLIAAFDLALIIAAAMVLLWAWGFGLAEFNQWIRLLVDGVKIGNFTLSLTDLLVAVLVFVVILFATRTLQRFLEEQVFPQTRLDMGVRHSLKTAAGYAGLVIAAAIAISALGLDLSNLAIIAGALSVGIGFGLQNIVNNFVSGLILLVERPVKVGDWVVVGAHQGYVKRINVRATELETFQRSSVIIPNSELLSTSVINWTHKDTNARVDIAVGVAYGSDIELVRETLLQCARNDSRVSTEPEPFVLFQNFGESSLDFELRFYIAHAEQSFRIASDVRFEITRAFEDKGITIPFPQRDLHVRSVAEGARMPKLDNPGKKETGAE